MLLLFIYIACKLITQKKIHFIVLDFIIPLFVQTKIESNTNKGTYLSDPELLEEESLLLSSDPDPESDILVAKINK